MDPSLIPSDVERALAVSAHPDDADFFAGATLAALGQAGTDVSLVVCTDGARGGQAPRDLVKTRRHEQAAAAQILGVSEVIHLALPDGELWAGEPLRELLVAAIRRLRPQLVLAHDPRTWFKPAGALTALGHSDHRGDARRRLPARGEQGLLCPAAPRSSAASLVSARALALRHGAARFRDRRARKLRDQARGPARACQPGERAGRAGRVGARRSGLAGSPGGDVRAVAPLVSDQLPPRELTSGTEGPNRIRDLRAERRGRTHA